MRLSDLARLCAEHGEDDPIVAVKDRNGMPVIPADINFGVVMTDAGPQPYVVLSPPDED